MSKPSELGEAIQRLCLAFPATEQLQSHGSPNFRIVGGKIFATYSVNHHGDNRVALWLNAPNGMQDVYVRADPEHFFKPPYVGPRGWLGVRLDKGIAWKRIAELVRMAYENTAPRRLSSQVGETPRIPAPRRRPTAAQMNPANTPRGKRIMAAMRRVCLDLPQTTQATRFGQPVWKVGKKVFANAYCHDGRWRVAFWVGIAPQGLMTDDPRFEIPPYTGHNGWIALDVSKRYDPVELRSLALASYRHFALKRMLSNLSAP